jgi:YidC/Oxa1 family membrane protein insertase
MQNENTRNTVIFVIATMVILLLYQFLVLNPAQERRRVEAQRQQAAAATNVAAGLPASNPGVRAFVDRRQAVATSPRVRVETPLLAGSISLQGGRIDDVFLKQYRETLEEDSPPVELFRPEGAQFAYFAEFGWIGQNLPNLPGPNTVWRQVGGDVLAPNKPVILTHDNGAGLVFTRTLSVDERYLFTVSDRVENRTGGPVTLVPYGSVQRHGLPADLGKNQILHEGAIGVFQDKLKLAKYPGWAKKGTQSFESTGGWTGITDKYWLAAMIPSQSERIESAFRVTKVGDINVFEANYRGQARAVPAGGSLTETSRLFAGAKRDEILDAYGKQLGAPQFDQAIDWGNFWFLTRPIFWVLEQFFQMVGNFGVAILMLTVVVRLLFYPLSDRSYATMAKMRNLAPKMEEIKKKHANDPAKQQQEIMAMYQKEKLNPLAGCLPILVQIPVFYALYKTLAVTIEMRHAPFFGWVQDLSSRDPTTIFNLFGLIPWDPATAPLIGGFLNGPLHLGVLPLLYGFTMWLQTGMNPPAQDPMQQKIFQLMPLIFTFIMAPFAVGLLIYWTWSNVLTIIQQYIIMRRYKTPNPIDDFLAKVRNRSAPAKA